MVKVLVLSDLHLEVCREEGHAFEFDPGDAELIVLAGDVDVGMHGIGWAGDICKQAGVPVVYIAGNHEYWGQGLDLLPKLRSAAYMMRRQGLPVWFLERETALVPAGNVLVRVVGATLWTDFTLFGEDKRKDSMKDAARHMPDYAKIRTDMPRWFRRLKPKDTLEICERTVAWMWDTLVHPYDGPTLVATHMAPSTNSVSSEFKDHRLSPAFASDFDDLLEFTDTALWVHGHTHDTFDYRLNGTQVVCNPMGYWPRNTNKNFQKGFTVSI